MHIRTQLRGNLTRCLIGDELYRFLSSWSKALYFPVQARLLTTCWMCQYCATIKRFYISDILSCRLVVCRSLIYTLGDASPSCHIILKWAIPAFPLTLVVKGFTRKPIICSEDCLPTEPLDVPYLIVHLLFPDFNPRMLFSPFPSLPPSPPPSFQQTQTSQQFPLLLLPLSFFVPVGQVSSRCFH